MDGYTPNQNTESNLFNSSGDNSNNFPLSNIGDQKTESIFRSNSPITGIRQQMKRFNFKYSPSHVSITQNQFKGQYSSPIHLESKEVLNILTEKLTSEGQISINKSTPVTPPPSSEVQNYYTTLFKDIQVKFPYEHQYEAQKQLISNSLLAFKASQNALLESPTGTGKSLAILSATLSFIETNPKVKKVFYTSNDQSRLHKLVGEFKKLPYSSQMSILASKKHLCIVPQVALSNSPDYECKKLCEEDGGCPYNNPYKKVGFDIEDVKVPNDDPIPTEFTSQGSKPKFDLDDLKEYGLLNQVCPYQLAFNIYHTSKLVFCPYNYILKANDNKNLLFDFQKNTTIAIFDEGHNIENTAREEASLTLTLKQIIDSQNEVKNVPHDDSFRTLFNQVQRLQIDIITFIKKMRFEYDKNFQSIDANNRPKYLAAESLESVFVCTNEHALLSMGIQMWNWLRIFKKNDVNYLKQHKMYVNETLVSFFSTCADIFMSLTPTSFDFYRIVFVPDEKRDLQNDKFRLLCLKPSFLFNKINTKTKSIIITSGTLSPLESFAAELESSFPIRVSAPHVVDPSHVLTISINSYQNVRITSRFSTLQSNGESIYNALSQIISTTLRTVPGGSLLFAPSYYTKDSIIRQWKSTNMYDVISSIKPIVEEKSNVSAKDILNQYKSYINGAFLIGVSCGKINEIIDFSDNLSHIVYVFGIPCSGFNEADVELKMKYNDIRHSTNSNYLSGQDWYTCQSFRELFRSIEKLFKGQNDYGAIVFLDDQIELNIDKFPTWLKTSQNSNFLKSQTADQAASTLSSFYQQMNAKYQSINKSSFTTFESNTSHQNTMYRGFNFSTNSFNQKKSFNSENLNSNPSQNSFYQNNTYNSVNINISLNNNNSTNYNNSFTNTTIFQTNLNQNIEKKNVNHSNFKKKDKKKENRFYSKMYCNHCRSLAIKLENLDLADFKDIKFPEFFELLDMNETKIKAMSLMEDDIFKDFTSSTKQIFSVEESLLLLKKECLNCGMPLAAFVSDAKEDSKFKKGEILFRQDMIAMKFNGQFKSLCEFALDQI